MAEIWVLVGFHIFILAMLALDLGIFQRQAHAIGMKEAVLWSVVWILLSLAFAVGIWQYWHIWKPESPQEGSQKALEFITGYVVEKALSIDNLFVFVALFRSFAVPAHWQPKVLYWGIGGAVLLRAALILAGAAMLAAFHWMLYVFGVFLIYTGYRLSRSREKQVDPARNPLIRLARRFIPIADDYQLPHFWVYRHGRWHATLLLLALLVVETTDVVFALDSIPAIFGITRDTFIVYTSNIFAILGLRALYFVLARALKMFRYLNLGLALVLVLIGIKMLAAELMHPYLTSYGIGDQDLTFLSLGLIGVILAGAALASLWAWPKDPSQQGSVQN